MTMLNLQQCRALGYCLWGVRRFCTRYQLDFKKLRDGSMPAYEFEATGQHHAIKLVEYAKKQEEESK